MLRALLERGQRFAHGYSALKSRKHRRKYDPLDTPADVEGQPTPALAGIFAFRVHPFVG
jgi:hypothetical protein